MGLDNNIRLGKQGSEVAMNTGSSSGNIRLNKDNQALKVFDFNKDGVLDASERNAMNTILRNAAGKDNVLSEKEIRESGYFEKGQEKDVYSSLSALNEAEQSLQKNGYYVEKSEVRSFPSESKINADGQITERMIDAGNQGKFTAAFSDDGICTGVEVAKKEDNKNVVYNYEMLDKSDKEGLIDYDTDGNVTNARPTSKTVNPGLPTEEVTTYTYAEDGSVTEVTKNSAGEVISTVNKDKAGNVIESENEEEKPKEKPVEEKPAELHSYTVQNGESFTNIIKKSLQAQGIENPTAEQIKEAKEEFKKNNPDAVKTSKKSGVEYLLVGAKVNLTGKLEDKNNAAEQINNYEDKIAARKEEKQNAEAKVEDKKAVDTLKKFANAKSDEFEVKESKKIADADRKLGVEKAYWTYLDDGSQIRIDKDAQGNIIRICITNADKKDNKYDNEYYKDKLKYQKNGIGDWIQSNDSYKPVMSYDDMVKIAEQIFKDVK
ncbi:MAG: hypothetical protein LBJ74_03490 [Heliobacteriaceae bacterium]|nr:hypothetical protein [Heliobacteriaceae bacterium]